MNYSKYVLEYQKPNTDKPISVNKTKKPPSAHNYQRPTQPTITENQTSNNNTIAERQNQQLFKKKKILKDSSKPS